MKIIPTSTFTGYPDAVKTVFREGVESDVSTDYGNLLIKVGRATKAKPEKKPDAPDDDKE